MHGGYLRKAAVAAARTSSPAKALRSVLPAPVPRAAAGPALRTDAFSVEDGTAQATGMKESSRFVEPAVSAVDGSAEVSGELSGKRSVGAPLSAAVRTMTKPVQPSGEGASETRREGPPALAQTAQSEAQASAMAGVLQRLSRPATRVEAPVGLREMRAATASARSKAVLPAAEGAHSSGEQVRTGDDLDAAKGIASHRPFQEVHGKAMHGASRDAVVVRSLVEPARTSAGESMGATLRMESTRGEGDERGAAAKLKGSISERQRMNPVEAAGQDGKAVERLVEQISAKTTPLVERASGVTSRQVEQVAVPATAGGQSKGERKVRIGQIDVQVNNQPVPRRTAERSGSVAQKVSGVASSQDLSRFLLRY